MHTARLPLNTYDSEALSAHKHYAKAQAPLSVTSKLMDGLK